MYIYLLKNPKPGDRCITYPVELHLFFFIPRGTPLFLHESCLTQQLLLCSIHEAMRDGLMRKFVILPFSLGCVSHSSIALGENQPKTAQEEPPPATPSGELEKKSMAGKTKSSFGLRAAPTIQKLIKSIKSLSQLFAVYEEEDEEIEMEIGFPTDVQHVAHIGWDGFNSMSTMNMKSWAKDPDFFSLPSRSVR